MQFWNILIKHLHSDVRPSEVCTGRPVASRLFRDYKVTHSVGCAARMWDILHKERRTYLSFRRYTFVADIIFQRWIGIASISQ